jgi:hypothetical protein
MTPTQRRYLEHAVRCEGGEFRWSVRSGGAEGAMHRMVKMLVAAGLVAFDPQQMAWIVTRAGRAAVKEGPPGASRTPVARSAGKREGIEIAPASSLSH